MPLPQLIGTKILLRQLRKSDAPSITRYASNPRVSFYLPRVPHPYRMKDAEDWVKESHRLKRTDRGYHFGIAEIGRVDIIGCIGLNNVNRVDKNAEVGYWVAEPFWNNGYMTETVRLIVKYAFKEQRLRRVYAIVHSSNIGSIKVLEHNGFVREGTFRKACLLGGRYKDVRFYGLLREEFRG